MRYLSSSLPVTYTVNEITDDRYCCDEFVDLVQFFVKLIELSCLRHDIFVHHERWLDLLVTLFAEEVKAVGNKGLVQIDAFVCEEVASVASYFGTYINRFRSLLSTPT